MKASLVYFVIVGTAAAAVHLCVVWLLVALCAWPAIAANPVGFLVAFAVSFGGHARWTFPLQRHLHRRAVRRFFVLAATGFVLNQMAFEWGLQRVGTQFYLTVLLAVMLGVAALTFVLGKAWAFAPEAVR